MNLGDLRERLESAGINPRFYSLCEGDKEVALCIECGPEAWRVYWFERGARGHERTFTEEGEACEYFWSRAQKDLVG